MRWYSSEGVLDGPGQGAPLGRGAATHTEYSIGLALRKKRLAAGNADQRAVGMYTGHAHLKQLIGRQMTARQMAAEIRGYKVLCECRCVAGTRHRFRCIEGNRGQVAADKAATVSEHFFFADCAECGHTFFECRLRNRRCFVQRPTGSARPGRKGKQV